MLCVQRGRDKAEGVYEPAEYWPQYMLSVNDATAVPLVFGMIACFRD
jgi:hypothetical protein